MEEALRIAMWSGPRNLSTAMMYAFAARGDCAVTDEPFYAAYLALTGLDHPMRDAILASQPTDPAVVAETMAGPEPGGRPLWYQKHMTHHMVPGIPRGWLESCRNAFLIRHPARVVASYLQKREEPDLADLGFVQQAELFDRVCNIDGALPPVIDSHAVRADPAAALSTLCGALGIGWDPRMLSWPQGGHPEDGVWAAHWYGAVHRSTGFDAPEPPLPELPAAAARLVDAALPYYRRMAAHALVPGGGATTG
jgi:hypothetical protein